MKGYEIIKIASGISDKEIRKQFKNQDLSTMQCRSLAHSVAFKQIIKEKRDGKGIS